SPEKRRCAARSIDIEFLDPPAPPKKECQEEPQDLGSSGRLRRGSHREFQRSPGQSAARRHWGECGGREFACRWHPKLSPPGRILVASGSTLARGRAARSRSTR